MKFRYYITNLFEGAIQGTDDEEAARNMAACEDFFVVDSATGMWLTPDGDEEVERVADRV